MTGTTFLSNTASFGGGAHFWNNTAAVAGTTFLSNAADYGGGAATGDFVNTLFAANRAITNQGAGLYIVNYVSDDVVTLRHVTIASPTVGSGSAVYVAFGTVNLTNTIVASYSVGLERVGGVLSENYNLFSSVATPYSGTVVSGGNSITGTVGFANPTADDYHLSDANSCAVDGGVNGGVLFDFDNDARPQGNGFDLGYDESTFTNAQVCSLSASNDSPTPVNTPTAFAATATGAGPIVYLWEFGDGAFGSGASPVHTYTAPGNYTAILTATNGFNTLTVTTPVIISVALCFATPDDGATVFSSVDARAVRSAVGAAAPNSRVKVAGTCAGVATQSGSAQVVLITQPLTLAGGYTSTNWITPDLAAHLTTLDALGGGRVISTINVTVTLQDFTITNGYLNAPYALGGGLYAAGPVVVSNTTFLSNTVGSGRGGGAYFSDTATVADTTFVNNTAIGYYYPEGGGAYFSSAATVTGTTFLSNTAPFHGGGALFYGAATVIGTIFRSNTTTFNGGGALFYGVATVTGTTFLSNTASWYGGGAFFGGPGPTTVVVSNTTFTGNTADYGGGAYFGGSAWLPPFVVNAQLESSGGDVPFGRIATVTGTTFQNNTAGTGGGGVYFSGWTGDFVNVLFVANCVYSYRGAALYGNEGVVTLRHATIAGPTIGSDSAMYVLNSTVNLTNTIVASYSVGLENAGGVFIGVLNEDYNLFSGVARPYSGRVVSGGNSMTGAAAFADTILYKLTGTSAAIDNGTNAGVTSDFEGEARPLGAGFDIGWDEYSGAYAPITGLAVTNDSPKQVVHAIRFTATISAGTGVRYQWNFGDNSPISNLQSPTHYYAAPGNYTAIVTATNSLGSLSASTPVTVPEAAFKRYLPLITRNVSPSALAPQSESAPTTTAGQSVPSQAARPVDPFPKA